MDVTYKNTIEDLIHLQKYIFQNTQYGKRYMRRFFINAVIIFSLLAISFALLGNQEFALYFFFSGLIIIWLLKDRLLLLRLKKTYQNEIYKPMWEEVTISITKEGLKTKRESGEGLYKWTAVNRAVDDGKYLLIIIQGMGNIVIPHSAFAGSSQKNSFYREIIKHIPNNLPTI